MGEAITLAVLPSLLVGVVMLYWQRKQTFRDKEVDARSLARKKEGLLAIEMQMATAKLSYVCAMALKRGQANGEVKDAVEAYEGARGKYLTFLNEQAQEILKK